MADQNTDVNPCQWNDFLASLQNAKFSVCDGGPKVILFVLTHTKLPASQFEQKLNGFLQEWDEHTAHLA